MSACRRGQRSGGTAKAYGMTLEELIQVSLRLSVKQPDVPGENLGTAINSLITYTTRAKSINVLEEMGIQAKRRGNLLPVLDILSQLAQRSRAEIWHSLTLWQRIRKQCLVFSRQPEREYQQAVEETIASGQEVQDAYSIAGTYRKNCDQANST